MQEITGPNFVSPRHRAHHRKNQPYNVSLYKNERDMVPFKSLTTTTIEEGRRLAEVEAEQRGGRVVDDTERAIRIKES